MLLLKKHTKFLKYREKYDVVISKNPLLTGLSAVIIAKLTQRKSVIEINGDFTYAFDYNRKGRNTVTLSETIKSIISKKIIVFVIKNSDRVKLLYSGQLEPLNIGKRQKEKYQFSRILLRLKNFVMKK